MNCHKCAHKDCLHCKNSREVYNYKYSTYLDRDIAQPSTESPEKATPFPEDIEDILRKLTCTIFQLSSNELLCLQAIIQKKDLTQWAKEMEELSKRNKQFSRFRAFQTRKAILKKLGPKFAPALLTVGQKKKLKA